MHVKNKQTLCLSAAVMALVMSTTSAQANSLSLGDLLNAAIKMVTPSAEAPKETPETVSAQVGEPGKTSAQSSASPATSIVPFPDELRNIFQPPDTYSKLPNIGWPRMAVVPLDAGEGNCTYLKAYLWKNTKSKSTHRFHVCSDQFSRLYGAVDLAKMENILRLVPDDTKMSFDYRMSGKKPTRTTGPAAPINPLPPEAKSMFSVKTNPRFAELALLTGFDPSVNDRRLWLITVEPEKETKAPVASTSASSTTKQETAAASSNSLPENEVIKHRGWQGCEATWRATVQSFNGRPMKVADGWVGYDISLKVAGGHIYKTQMTLQPTQSAPVLKPGEKVCIYDPMPDSY